MTKNRKRMYRSLIGLVCCAAIGLGTYATRSGAPAGAQPNQLFAANAPKSAAIDLGQAGVHDKGGPNAWAESSRPAAVVLAESLAPPTLHASREAPALSSWVLFDYPKTGPLGHLKTAAGGTYGDGSIVLAKLDEGDAVRGGSGPVFLSSPLPGGPSPGLTSPDSRVQPLDECSDCQNLPLVVSPVPEPSTYALMLAGLLTIGVLARRRKPRDGQ